MAIAGTLAACIASRNHHDGTLANWHPASPLMGPCWNPTGTLVEPKWHPTGIQLDPPDGANWHPAGTLLTSFRHPAGTLLAPEPSLPSLAKAEMAWPALAKVALLPGQRVQHELA